MGSVDVLRDPEPGQQVDLLIVGVGEMATTAMAVAEKLAGSGLGVQVVDPRWCLPVSSDLVGVAADVKAVAVIEDNLVVGGVGSQVTQALREAGLGMPCQLYGIPKRFLGHASRGEVLEEIGLTPEAIADRITATMQA